MLWTQKPVLQKLVDFTVGDDFILDEQLLPYDIQGTHAHIDALKDCGLLSPEESKRLHDGLHQLLNLYSAGSFHIRKEQEDCHTAIEEFLVQIVGDVGKKIQAGRSRNDQVLTALRLYAKDKLSEVQCQLGQLVQAIKTKASLNAYSMPGYTHLQKAMPYSTSKWLEAFAESLENDMICLSAAFSLNDQSPLGSAAGYGSPLTLDREMQAKVLGFSKVQLNTLFCQNSRGKFELFTLAALDQVALTLNKLASDIILYSSEEFGFIKKPDSLCTGSSLMPHKKNPDVLELVRAKTAGFTALYAQVSAVLHNLPSGYNRDFQETKRPFMQAFCIVSSCTLIMREWIEQMSFCPEVLEKAMTLELCSAEKAVLKAQSGMPFREAYESIKKEF